MGSLSKSNIFNVGKHDPKQPRSAVYRGERRSERRPFGIVERFVDLQGNVVPQQLVPPGVPSSTDAINKARVQLHAQRSPDGSIQGFIEHGKCPMRHGLNLLTPTIEEEFAAMPTELKRPCEKDPVTATKTAKGVEYHDACPHIEWLIADRRRREAERRAARSSKQESVLDIERKKLALAEQQAADTRKVLEQVAGKAAPVARKPAAE